MRHVCSLSAVVNEDSAFNFILVEFQFNPRHAALSCKLMVSCDCTRYKLFWRALRERIPPPIAADSAIFLKTVIPRVAKDSVKNSRFHIVIQINTKSNCLLVVKHPILQKLVRKIRRQKFLDPDADPDDFQNLTLISLSRGTFPVKFSRRSDE